MRWSEDWSNYALLAPITVALLLVVSLLIFSLSLLVNQLMTTTPATSTAINIVSLAVNGMLTLFLVVIYHDIRKSEASQESSMEKQTEILNRQRELVEAQFEPIPRIEFSDEDIDGNEIEFTCKNSGTGIVRDLKLDIELFVGNTPEQGGVHVIDRHSLSPLSDVEETDEEMVDIGGGNKRKVVFRKGFYAAVGSLEYAESENREKTRSEPVVKEDEAKRFSAQIYMMEYSGPAAEPGEAEITSFEGALSDLIEIGYDVIGYRLEFRYSDILDEESGPKVLGSGFTELDADLTFEDMYKESRGRISHVSHPGMNFEDYVASQYS